MLPNGKIKTGTGLYEEGCTIEFCEIKTAYGQWWSIGFEAFATKKTVANNFIKAMDYIEKTISIKRIVKRKNSMGYPEWLQKVSK